MNIVLRHLLKNVEFIMLVSPVLSKRSKLAARYPAFSSANSKQFFQIKQPIFERKNKKQNKKCSDKQSEHFFIRLMTCHSVGYFTIILTTFFIKKLVFWWRQIFLNIYGLIPTKNCDFHINHLTFGSAI